MTQHVHGPRENDRAMVHHFIRVVGRAPTEEELLRFQGLRSEIGPGRRLGLRQRAARLLIRL